MASQDAPRFEVQLELSTTQENRRELVQTLASFRQRALDEGYACEVFEDLFRANVFVWIEGCRSEEQLQETLRSVGFLSLLGAIEVLGLLESARVSERRHSETLDEIAVSRLSTGAKS